LNALDVVHEIIERHGLFDARFTLIVHPPAPGWRQRHRTTEQRIDHSLDDVADVERNTLSLSGQELFAASLDDLTARGGGIGNLLSICSRVRLPGGVRHLALMDLHPEEFIPYDRLTRAVRSLCCGQPFRLLRTDRHHHVYGDFTMDEREWVGWNARFQMPVVLVDAHYVGRSLQLGYNALRLNAATEYQLVVPTTVDRDPDLRFAQTAVRSVELVRRHQSKQLRKSGEPTMHHLREVAELAVQIRDECVAHAERAVRDVSPEDLYACGYLHDSIEDTATDFEDIEQAAGRWVADWVRRLSEDKREPAGRRRSEYERQLAEAPLAVQIVKLADLLSNLRGLRGSEPVTWIGDYLQVSRRQLELLAAMLHETASYDEADRQIRRWRLWLQERQPGDEMATPVTEAHGLTSSRD
jgi:hypothetical protein